MAEQTTIYTAIDLFCGAGGLSLGLTNAGFSIVGAVDASRLALATYRRNFSHPAICEDVRELTGKKLLERLGCASKIDLLAGGPPCQGFSIQRIGGDTDSRNSLVLEFARMVSEIRPAVFLMENVLGLLGKRGKAICEQFAISLAAGGYEVRNAVINAAEYGVPQIRKRVFYYGWLQSGTPIEIPRPTHNEETFETVMNAIGDLCEPSNARASVHGDELHRRTQLSRLNLERLRYIPPGGGFEDLPVPLRARCHRNGAARIGHRYVYGRLAPDAPAATITGRFDSFTRGKFAHPYEDRNITLREGARLQTFPDTFQFQGTQEEIAAQIGNAVPPVLAAVLGEAVLSAIRGRRKSSAYNRESPIQFELAFHA